MAKSETVQAMTDGQKNEIVETMICAMPSLSFDQAQEIIGNKGPFASVIHTAFEPYLGSKPTTKPTDLELLTELTIGDRIYELVSFLKEGESSVKGHTMVGRAKELNANPGHEDGTFILKRQDDIPREFQRKFYLVFTDWRNPLEMQSVAYIGWTDYHWCVYWGCLEDDWEKRGRLLRRRT